MRCFSDGTALPQQPGNGPSRPTKIWNQKIRGSEGKSELAKKERNSTTGLILIQSTAAVCPDSWKIGEIEKRLTQDSEPFTFK